MIHHPAKDRTEGEPFDDFVIRAGYIGKIQAGREFDD